MQQYLIQTLEARVTEVEWFGRQHGLLVEPHLYPKGLFHVQADPVQSYHLPAYVAELRQDLNKLKKMSLPLLRVKAADKLLQKVNVLINAFRSQDLRIKRKKSLRPFQGEVNLETGNIYQYLLEKNQPPSHERLKKLLVKQQSDRKILLVSLNEKECQLKRVKDVSQLTQLQNSILALSKQIGAVEQRITRIKEELSQS